MLKEGYMLSLDSLWFPPAPPFEHVRIANFTIVKNGETVKKISANQGDVFYYNKIIDGKEYTIIEAKVEGIYLGTQTILVRLEPFYQYSDGSTVNEKGISAANSKASKDAAPSEEWNRTFGGKDEDAIMSVQQTGDGGYFLARSIPALWMGLSGTLIGLNKTDAGGNEQWNKTIFEYGAQVHSIQQTADDGFAVAGDIISTDTLDAWLVKIDSNGSKQWKKTFGGGEYGETAYSVSQTGDGGYILAGITSYYGDGGSYAYLTKVSGEQTVSAKTPTANPTQTLTAVPTGIHKVSPYRKDSGFEVFLAITTLLLVVIIRGKRSN